MPAQPYVLVHYHEVGLKGRNRSLFERALARNLARAAADVAELEPRRLPGRILVPVRGGTEPEAVAERFAHVFGVANVAVARGGTLEFDGICAVAGELMAGDDYETFAVRARTAHSSFPMSAREINEKLGAWLLERTGKRVNLSRPDRTCHVEIVGDLVLVYTDRREGAGGLPVGVSGRLAALISSGIDSPVAAARMMRRGARCTFVHFHSQPFTDASSVRNTEELVTVLTRYQFDSNLYLVALAPSQQQIAASAPEELRTVLYRRQMMRIASRLAAADGAKGLVTGDSLGQVASQTIENLAAVEAAASLPVLRPLIGRDKTEIIDESRALGLFEISSAPCQEACVLFEPRSPATKARVADCERADAAVPVDDLAREAAESAELRVVRFP